MYCCIVKLASYGGDQCFCASFLLLVSESVWLLVVSHHDLKQHLKLTLATVAGAGLRVSMR